MKKIGFLSFGHWSASPYSQVRSASDALHPVDRARRGGRGAGRGRRVLPRPPLRPAARLAVPAPRGDRRAHEAHRDRHRRHRHALREPALHGRGRRRRRPHRRRPAAARASAVDRPSRSSTASATSATCRPRARPTPTWRASHTEVFLQALSGAGLRPAEPSPDVPQPARPAAPGAALARAARPDLVGRGIRARRPSGPASRA